MDLLNIAAQLLKSKLGAQGEGLDLSSIVGALGGLLPTTGSDLDLAALVGQMNGGSLASMAASFLGDGPNQSLSPANLISLFGEGKVSDFASNLNLDKDTALNGLSSMIPDLIDKSSVGGDLMKDMGGKLAGNLMGKLFGG